MLWDYQVIPHGAAFVSSPSGVARLQPLLPTIALPMLDIAVKFVAVSAIYTFVRELAQMTFSVSAVPSFLLFQSNGMQDCIRFGLGRSFFFGFQF